VRALIAEVFISSFIELKIPTRFYGLLNDGLRHLNGLWAGIDADWPSPAAIDGERIKVIITVSSPT
jgi:hypothetical protein